MSQVAAMLHSRSFSWNRDWQLDEIGTPDMLVGAGSWTGILPDTMFEWQRCLKYMQRFERIEDTVP